MNTTITISKETKSKLDEHTKKNQSYDNSLSTLLDHYSKLVLEAES